MLACNQTARGILSIIEYRTMSFGQYLMSKTTKTFFCRSQFTIFVAAEKSHYGQSNLSTAGGKCVCLCACTSVHFDHYLHCSSVSQLYSIDNICCSPKWKRSFSLLCLRFCSYSTESKLEGNACQCTQFFKVLKLFPQGQSQKSEN